MQKESDCQSNGIILATLTGPDIDNGNIDLSDAKFGISSTTTSYVQPPVSNNGIITNVPPGTYEVTVQAYCKKTNSWVVKSFKPVSVTGSYVVPNINKMYVVSANIQKSLKCEPTGLVPINVEGGKPPYTVTISSAPSGYSGPTTFIQPAEGVLSIPDLPAGDYVFDVSDNCTYTLYGLQAEVEEIQPSYYIDTIIHTAKCAKDGVVSIVAKDGAAPYTIVMTAKPSGYTGPQTFTLAADGTIDITGLPVGSYTFKVKDKCHEETLMATVEEIKFEVSQGNISGTTSCDNTGSVAVEVEGGQAPYTITVLAAPSCFSMPWSQTYPTEGVYTIDGLCEGTYKIEVKDNCGTAKVLSGIAIVAVHLQASVKEIRPATASCATTGEADIEIIGGKKPYKIRLVSTDSPLYVNPGTQTTSDTIFSIKNLSPGSYVYEVEDACGEKVTVSFTIDYVPMSAIVQTVVSSFECIATGQLLITIMNGMPPYTVDMTVVASDPTYTGPTSGFTPTSHPDPNGNVFEINNLPNGIYNFDIKDACGDVINVTGVVDSLPLKYPFNFYHDYFLPPKPNDSNCKDVTIRRNNNATGSLGQYWNNNPGKYYEVAFAEDIHILSNASPPPTGLLDTLAWNPVSKDVDSLYTLSRTYCTMRQENGYVVVYMRVKDDNAYLCGVSTDTVWMADVKTKLGTPYDESCDGYKLQFEQYDDHRGLFCYPYSWKLLNMSSAVIASNGGINTPASQTVINIPYGKHVFEFTDAEGCSWYSDTIDYYWSPPPVVDFTTERNCGFYNLIFEIKDVCPPYDWKLYDLGMVIIASKTNVYGGIEKVSGLEYGKDYILEIIYNGGQDSKTFPIKETATLYHNYQISFEPSYCLPDTGKGAIFIHRDITMPNFEKGSYIEFVSGPTTPQHTYIPILRDNIDKVYPFSADSLAHSFQPITPGSYKFKLTDTCGIAHPLLLQYDIAKLEGFDYTKDETCEGVKIYPVGTIYLGGVAQPTYFRISSAPLGIAVNPASVTEPDYLFLPESGEYEIQASAEDSPTSCPIGKLKIYYEKQSVSLDADSTEAYVCEAGNVGFIKVVRKGGIGPFEYELFDQGVSVGKNSTGRFSYGSPGNTYTIRIKDEGCKVSFDQDIMLINLANERLIYGTTGYCPGDVIELNSLPVNTSGYYWEGPNGFTSFDQHPRIPNADSTHQGTYTLSIQPEGCVGAITQSIDVGNFKPGLPMADPVCIVCLHTTADPLQATPSSTDYVLKWYDRNASTPLSSAPVPSTAAVDTITFYVSQVNTIWGCEGDKIPVTAAISDLPSIDLKAQAPVICPGMVPTIEVSETNAGYVYSLYNTGVGGSLLGMSYSPNGETVSISSGSPVMSDATFYVEVIDENGCVSPGRKSVKVSTDNYLEIKPDELPQYKRGKPFSMQLQSNAVEPSVYSSNYGLPLGFNLTTSGLITGVVPGNGYFDPKSFDVKLVDANGCVATKLYTLTSEPFIPNTFTPNGDGYNDVFMKGHHLIIFDRLGVVIFEGNDGWDGKRNNGKKAPPDTYFYILDYKHDNGLIDKKKGYITLLERE